MRASRGVLLLLGVCGALVRPHAARAQPVGDGPEALLDRLEGAWARRDVAGYLALWELPDEEARQEERAFASIRLGAEESRLILQRPPSLPTETRAASVNAQLFTVAEPRARVEHWLFSLEKRAAGWALTGREDQGLVDGLVHLSLDSSGVRADGLVLRLEDFEIEMQEGTLYMPPRFLGPTVLVFVGEGRVRVSPRPPSERDQLRQFCGSPELVDRVRAFFARIHPADLARVLSRTDFQPDPGGPRRFERARRFYQGQVEKAFVLDTTTLPGSPWWLLPSPGDAVVSFETRRRGTLTFTVSQSEPEDINLFDRDDKRQILLYPSQGRSTHYSEDDVRMVDVLHHDLQARFEPQRYMLQGRDTLHLRTMAPAATIRLRLDEALGVESVTSAEGGSHLFFRVRGQNSIVVSLGPLTGVVGEMTLTVRYAGALDPGPLASEIVQLRPSPLDADDEQQILLEDALLYTNRSAWYPRAENDDHATARLRFDVPEGYSAVTGGELRSERSAEGRTLLEYDQRKPGKYLSVAVGRFSDMGMRQEGPYAVRGFGLPRTRSDAQSLLPQVQSMLQFYEAQFGPCPYPSLSLAVTEARAPGGHAPPGMVLLQKRPLLFTRQLRDDPANFSDIPGFFLAHELAHQWWGHGVAGQNYREIWLSEGAAQYAAALWVRESEGEGEFRRLLERMARWAHRHAKEGPISLGYRLGHLKRNPQIYRAIVYDKGAYVLHMLRAIVGDGAFRHGLAAFIEGHRFAKAGTEDLREALEAASGKDLEPYFRAWIDGTALPLLRYRYRRERVGTAYRAVVEVRPQDLPGPVPLEITISYSGGTDERTVTLRPEGGTFTFEVPSRPRKVELNRSRTLLARVKRG